MNLNFRSFQEKDPKGIVKNFMGAFCKTRICEPMSLEFWEWKYGSQRPNYAPEGYQICERKGKIVGTIMTTIRTMKFDGTVYRAAGIDDVATCPILERHGIGKRLMENAINFMEQDQNVDLSILCADPRGHAKKIYWRLGYTYTTYLSVALKIISIRNTLKKFTLFFPFALPLRLYASLKTKRRKKKYKENLTFAVLGKDQDEFRQKLNENYSSIFYSFNEFDQKYWDWYHIQRPKSHESIAIAAKENGKIIAGGVITKSYLMVLNTKKWVPLFILTELFVQKPYQKRGIGSYLLARLEEVAKRRGVPGILIHFHGRNAALRTLLKKMGYLCMNKVTLQMIKPISERAKEHFQQIQGKKFVWKIPWEQMGF